MVYAVKSAAAASLLLLLLLSFSAFPEPAVAGQAVAREDSDSEVQEGLNLTPEAMDNLPHLQQYTFGPTFLPTRATLGKIHKEMSPTLKLTLLLILLLAGGYIATHGLPRRQEDLEVDLGELGSTQPSA